MHLWAVLFFHLNNLQWFIRDVKNKILWISGNRFLNSFCSLQRKILLWMLNGPKKRIDLNILLLGEKIKHFLAEQNMRYLRNLSNVNQFQPSNVLLDQWPQNIFRYSICDQCVCLSKFFCNTQWNEFFLEYVSFLWKKFFCFSDMLREHPCIM